jgi:hypothetical protein
MTYYLLIKGNEMITYATTWMNLKNSTSEISQTPKDKYLHYEARRTSKCVETESRMEVARDCGEEKQGAIV